MTDLLTVILNQVVLYITILVAPLAVNVLIIKIFTAMEFKGVGMLFALSICDLALSLWGLVPLYITCLVIGFSVYSFLSARRNRIATQIG